MERLSCSGRAVSRWLGICRGTLRYMPKALPEKKQLLEAEMVRVSRGHPPLGYTKITQKIREMGLAINTTKVVWPFDS